MSLDRHYRFRVQNSTGSAAGARISTGNAEFTFSTTEGSVRLTSLAEFGGEVVRPLTAKVEARPWSVRLGESSTGVEVTSKIASAVGRVQWLQRRGDLSTKPTTSGSTYTVRATGRISDISLASRNPIDYEVRLMHEQEAQRRATLFEGANTTWLAPGGLENAWYTLPRGSARLHSQGRPTATVIRISTADDTTTYRTNGFHVIDEALQLLKDDVVAEPEEAAGNFEFLRANIDGTDREVSVIRGSRPGAPVEKLEKANPLPPGVRSVGQFTVAGYQDPGGVNATYTRYFYMPDKDPSPVLPLHIGGRDGIDPFTLVKDIYDGSYQSTGSPVTVLYSTAAFSAYHPTNNPDGLIDHPAFSKQHFRVRGPANMPTWLDQNIYEPLGVAPMVNARGEIDPRLVRLPAPDQVPNPDNLFEFNASNSHMPHPSWQNQGREQVTVVRITFEHVVPPEFTEVDLKPPPVPLDGTPRPTEHGSTHPRLVASEGLDLFREREEVIVEEHDRVDETRSVHEVTIRGIHRPEERREFAKVYAQQVFNRFGDGPIYTTIQGMSTTESVEAGDWVVIDLDTYPAPQNQSRSGKRLAQVLSRVDTVSGPRFELLEAGPDSQPLSAPTITVSASTSDPHHAVAFNVSNLPSGAEWKADIAISSTEPPEESPEWQHRKHMGFSAGDFTHRRLPSGETIWMRARATAERRIASDYSTAGSQTTTALTAPSAVSSTAVTGDTAILSWTNGEDDYDVQVDLDSDYVARVQAGSAEYRLTDLDPSTSSTAGVRHVDDYGGESSRATTVVNTSTAAETLSDPDGIRILAGGDE